MLKLFGSRMENNILFCDEIQYLEDNKVELR